MVYLEEKFEKKRVTLNNFEVQIVQYELIILEERIFEFFVIKEWICYEKGRKYFDQGADCHFTGFYLFSIVGKRIFGSKNRI